MVPCHTPWRRSKCAPANEITGAHRSRRFARNLGRRQVVQLGVNQGSEFIRSDGIALPESVEEKRDVGHLCTLLLAKLADAMGRTEWLLHAFALMGNLYRSVLETPEPNSDRDMA